jgi:hypothetical protein
MPCAFTYSQQVVVAVGLAQPLFEPEPASVGLLSEEPLLDLAAIARRLVARALLAGSQSVVPAVAIAVALVAAMRPIGAVR